MDALKVFNFQINDNLKQICINIGKWKKMPEVLSLN